ncbi:MAG: hypothetical protein MUF42_17220, partial [Cytophagaceae bacterium]|nr:hypothetical protein [Cytophagaceae bacterium]
MKKSSFFCTLNVVWLLVLASTLRAQYSLPGELDTTFNYGEANSFMMRNDQYLGRGPSEEVNAIGLQSDGKLLIGGAFTSYNSIPANSISRLNIDGSMDTTFKYGKGANSNVEFIRQLPDGKILVGGYFSVYNGISRGRIVRLNLDGSVDLTFNPGTGANDGIFEVALQADGKLVIVGAFTTFNGVSRNRVARLNSDGSLDTSFDPGTGANADVHSVAIQVDGKIWIGGEFNIYNGMSRNKVACLNTNGSEVAIPNLASGVVKSLVLQSDGKVLIGGDFSLYGSSSAKNIVRLNADGSIDTGFNPGTGATGGTILSYVEAIVIRPDGKIIVVGSFTAYNGTFRNCIARLNADGSLDSSFDPGAGTDGSILSVVIKSDGKIVVGGRFGKYNEMPQKFCVRLNADGLWDARFNPATGANSTVNSIVMQADGKILIGGSFDRYNNILRKSIARINSNGSLDTSFNPTSWITNTGTVVAIAVQTDGKVLVGGTFRNSGTGVQNLARLNVDGSLDGTFNSGTGPEGTVRCLALQANGKILLGGFFASYNGTSCSRIIRLNSDGTLDLSFNTGLGPNDGVESMNIQPDGKIIVVGKFTSFNSNACNRIVRLNVDGSIDATFNAGTGASDDIYCLALQTDGKIVIGGSFTSFGGVSRFGIARLNTTGSLDTGFNPGTGANNDVLDLNLQLDGKVLICGFFTSFNGSVSRGLARLQANGSLDLSFSAGLGGSSVIRTLATQPDRKVLIGGDFLRYNGTFRSYLARIWTEDNTLDIETRIPTPYSILIYPNPANDYIVVESPESFQYEWYSHLGQKLMVGSTDQLESELDIDFLTPGSYVLKIITA